MPRPRLQVVICPDCQAQLETNLRKGELIQCPECQEVFRVGPANTAPAGSGKPSLARIIIPIAGVLLVAAVAGAVYWITTRDEDKPADDTRPATDVATKPSAALTARVPPADLPNPDPAGGGTEPSPTTGVSAPSFPAPRPADAMPPVPSDARKPPEPTEALTPVQTAPAPREAGEGKPEPTEVATLPEAPLPHEATLVQEAPEPREIVWKLPPSTWQSKWQTLGAVDLRITNVVVTHYPLMTAKGVVEDSKGPALAVVVEVKLNNPKRDRSLLGWTYGIARYGDATLPDGRQLSAKMFPAGAKVNHGFTFPIALPKDGTTVRDVLLFDVPPTGTKEIELRLDGDRVREPGYLVFKLPAESWQAKTR